MLQDIIDELAKPEYIDLNDVDALALIKSSSEFIQGPAQAGDVLSYLAQISKLIEVKTIAGTDAHPLQDASEAIMVTLNGRTQFDVHLPSVQAMLQGFVDAGVINTTQRGAILALGQSPKFTNCTLRQIRQARGKVNTESVMAIGNSAIKISVTGEIYDLVIKPKITLTNSRVSSYTLPISPPIYSGDNIVFIPRSLSALRASDDVFNVEIFAPNNFSLSVI